MLGSTGKKAKASAAKKQEAKGSAPLLLLRISLMFCFLESRDWCRKEKMPKMAALFVYFPYLTVFTVFNVLSISKHRGKVMCD
jgi:hypothetical protein